MSTRGTSRAGKTASELLGDTQLTALTWLLAFASVLGVEWWLRKKWGLV